MRHIHLQKNLPFAIYTEGSYICTLFSCFSLCKPRYKKRKKNRKKKERKGKSIYGAHRCWMCNFRKRLNPIVNFTAELLRTLSQTITLCATLESSQHTGRVVELHHGHRICRNKERIQGGVITRSKGTANHTRLFRWMSLGINPQQTQRKKRKRKKKRRK